MSSHFARQYLICICFYWIDSLETINNFCAVITIGGTSWHLTVISCVLAEPKEDGVASSPVSMWQIMFMFEVVSLVAIDERGLFDERPPFFFFFPHFLGVAVEFSHGSRFFMVCFSVYVLLSLVCSFGTKLQLQLGWTCTSVAILSKRVHLILVGTYFLLLGMLWASIMVHLKSQGFLGWKRRAILFFPVCEAGLRMTLLIDVQVEVIAWAPHYDFHLPDTTLHCTGTHYHTQTHFPVLNYDRKQEGVVCY